MSEDYLRELFGLHGRVALVTGSTGGLGLALAGALGRAGATVIVNGRTQQRVDDAVRRLGELGVEAGDAVFDVTDEDALNTGLDRIEQRYGPVSILVNNAGVQHRVPLAEVRLADWSRVLETNLTAVFLVARAVAVRMMRRGDGGKIINLGSLTSRITRPNVGPYAATKGGVKMLTQAMTAEWAEHGLQINALAPGYIGTEMTSELAADPEFNAWLVARTPAARWGTPQDLEGAAVFLASAASGYVNGQVLFVDGGTTAVM